MEISAGITKPRWLSVVALYALQKSMMLMPCGPSAVPTGGAGVAWPAWIWILTTAANRFFAIWGASSSFDLELRDLAELELDGRLAAEDVHEHLQLGAIDVDLGDRTVEVRERAGDDTHLLALLELHSRTDLLLCDRALGLGDAEDVLDLFASEWGRLGTARPDEARDSGGVADDVPGVVVEVHADEQVTGKHLLLDDPALAALELDHVLHREVDLLEFLLVDDFDEFRRRVEADGLERDHLDHLGLGLLGLADRVLATEQRRGLFGRVVVGSVVVTVVERDRHGQP